MLSTFLLILGSGLLAGAVHVVTGADHLVDLVIDGGAGGIEPSSVVDLSSGIPNIVRRGKGDVSAFE